MNNFVRMDRQRGVTLIELMISLVLGIIVLLGISAIFLTSTKVSNRTKNQISLDNQANAVLSRIKYDIYKAGYVDFTSGDTSEWLMKKYPATFYSIIARRWDFLVTHGLEDLNYGGIPSFLQVVTAPVVFPVYGCGGVDGEAVTFSDTPSQLKTILKTRTDNEATRGQWLDGDLIKGCSTPSKDELKVVSGSGSIMLAYQSLGPGFKAEGGSTKPKPATSVSGEGDIFTGEGYDCQGFTAESNSTDPSGKPTLTMGDSVVINSYFLTKRGLECMGGYAPSGTLPTLISKNVKGLNFRYRLALGSKNKENTDPGTNPNPNQPPSTRVSARALDPSGGRATGYLPAKDVDAVMKASSNGLREKANWNAVTAVEVCLVMAGDAQDGSRDSSIASDQLLIPTCNWDTEKGVYKSVDRPAGDTRMYKRYIATYSVPNAIFASAIGQASIPEDDSGNNSGGGQPNPNGPNNPPNPNGPNNPPNPNGPNNPPNPTVP